MMRAAALAFLYGVTYHGGAHDRGTVFVEHHRHVHAIYSFCSKGQYCADGAGPVGLLRLPNGDFVGTTLRGGLGDNGVLFRLTMTPNGWQESVLWWFGSLWNDDDGTHPLGALSLDEDGWVIGTTRDGGYNGHGIAWKWRNNQFAVRHSFGRRW